MKSRKWLRSDPLVVLFIIVALGGIFFSPRNASSASLPDNSSTQAEHQHGALVFEQSFFDFGSVTEGDIVRHTFKFRNAGAGPVSIVKTETSCGCTTASAALREYAPGESGEMEVVVDTKGKKGIVVKTVTMTLENVEQPTQELSLMMNLEPPPHPEIREFANINTESACKSCHLESAEGESAGFLFHRVCSQCHGKKGKGGYARTLRDEAWQQKVEDSYIRNVVNKGLPQQGMPSFVEGVVPPLTEEQVDSLVQYIRSLVNK